MHLLNVIFPRNVKIAQLISYDKRDKIKVEGVDGSGSKSGRKE